MNKCPQCNEPTFEVAHVKGMSLCPDCQLYLFEKRLFAWTNLSTAALWFKEAMDKDFDIDLTLEEIRRTLMEGDSK